MKRPTNVQSWHQLAMIAPSEVRVDLTVYVSGREASLTVGLTAREVGSDEVLLMELGAAQPLLSNPQELLERFHEVLAYYVDQISPF